MLTRPTDHQLRAAHVLRTQGQWGELESYLRAELQRVYELMVDSRDETVLRQLQGRAAAIKEFLTFVNKSSEVMEKIERPSGGTRGM